MNKTIQTTYDRCQRALAFTKQHDSQWTAEDSIRSVITNLSGVAANLAQLSSQQVTLAEQRKQATADQAGILEEMQTQLKAIIRMTRKISSVEADVIQTRLDKVTRQSEWIDLAESVVTNLENQVEVLVANGAKAGVLDELQQLATGMMEAGDRQTAAEVARLGVTRSLKAQASEGDRLLAVLNEALEMRLVKHPELMSQWAVVKRRHDLFRTPAVTPEPAEETGEQSVEPAGNQPA